MTAVPETSALEIIENLWIPLADGTRLAARLWLPETRPASCVLEYIPYRKTDGTRGRDDPMHGYFAQNGFAALRVDMRGTGESEGLCHDEYLPQELNDAVEVIAWIAQQPWSNGAIGMMGKSWGGFNCLQVAALRPPALKAIITVCSTDDRFADDIHYMGGCLLNDNLWWGTIMLAYQARPLDSRIVGEGWRQQWLQRLEEMPLWPALWLAHPTRDAYWKHGSVCEDFSAITCPVFAVGGWADSYTNAVPRLLQGLSVPRRGIIGPWAHIYPQDGSPGPAIGFLDEAVDWWRQWLDGVTPSKPPAPGLIAYIEDTRPPITTLTDSPGRWVAEESWPVADRAPQILHFGDGVLAGQPDTGRTLSIKSPLYTGSTSGEWMGAGCRGEMPGDQRIDDGFSLTFDSPPLEEALDILGFPVVELELAADTPTAQIAVRLNEVAADGASLRVSYAVLNLAHRDGFENPALLEPGRFYKIRLPLKVAGHRFPAGSRLRIAISTAYWPLIWPAADAATVTVATAGCRLELPVRPGIAGEVAPILPPPSHGPKTPITQIRTGELERQATLDQLANVMTYVTDGRGGVFGEGVLRFDDVDVTLGHDLKRVLTIHGDDPLSAKSEVTETYDMTVAGRLFRSVVKTAQTADRTDFHMTGSLDVYEDGALVISRQWDETLPRFPL